VRQCREEGTIGRSEPHIFVAELALQHGELVARGQDFGVLSRSLIGSSRSTAKVFVTVR
jgi:hypothetical protein